MRIVLLVQLKRLLPDEKRWEVEKAAKVVMPQLGPDLAKERKRARKSDWLRLRFLVKTTESGSNSAKRNGSAGERERERERERKK